MDAEPHVYYPGGSLSGVPKLEPQIGAAVASARL